MRVASDEAAMQIRLARVRVSNDRERQERERAGQHNRSTNPFM
jgi:hypothetical protein